MKYIQKSQEPESFTKWKTSVNENWKPTWDNFQVPEKKEVHKALLKDQGFICCYCGMRISRESSHIEHLQPRKIYPDLALIYTNLIASCQGERENPPPIPVHCGHKKGDWYDSSLMVSSLDINCSDFFRYTDDGQILATDTSEKQEAAATTIKKLGLNIDKLKSMREKAI